MRYAHSRFSRLHALLPALMLTGTGVAQEPPAAATAEAAPAGAAPADAAAEESIDRLIDDFDSDEFSVREDAARKLVARGAKVVAPLVDAAKAGSPEQGMRAVGVLAKLAKSNDAATRDAAAAGLERLGDAQAGSVAEAARKAARAAMKTDAGEAEESPPATPFPFPGFAPGGAIVKGVSVSVQNINGAKTTQVEEDGVKHTIEEAPGGAITVKTTEQVTEEGETKSKTTEFQAKNLDELKEKHPGAYDLYKKYGGGTGAVAVRLGIPGGPGIPAIPGAPALPGFPGFGGAGVPEAWQHQLDKVEQDLQAALAALKGQPADKPLDAAAMAKLVEQLEAARKQLDDLREKIGGEKE